MAESARIRFDRQEWSGAFGDLGTDLPLLVGIILASGMDAASALTLFGAMQILTALRYRLPMPVQPLKAMAALIIAQKIAPPVIFGAGLAIGLLMFALSALGLLDVISRAVPKTVIRGIQLGLGLQLARIALGDYVPAEKAPGFVLAAAAFLLTLAFAGRKRVPAGLLVVGLGLAWALTTRLSVGDLASAAGFRLPTLHTPSLANIWTGFLLLALPQVPLSIANSVLATKQVAADLFPHRPLTIRGIGLTYSLMNLINPWFGGIPTCHGSGGMAGHYAFGGRTGGSVILYGLLYITLGLFFSPGFTTVIQIFPLPILGVLLLFEAVTLITLIRDVAADRTSLLIVTLTGLAAFLLPYGFLIALLAGTLLELAFRRQWFRLSPH